MIMPPPAPRALDHGLTGFRVVSRSQALKTSLLLTYLLVLFLQLHLLGLNTFRTWVATITEQTGGGLTDMQAGRCGDVVVFARELVLLFSSLDRLLQPSFNVRQSL